MFRQAMVGGCSCVRQGRAARDLWAAAVHHRLVFGQCLERVCSSFSLAYCAEWNDYFSMELHFVALLSTSLRWSTWAPTALTSPTVESLLYPAVEEDVQHNAIQQSNSVMKTSIKRLESD